MNLFNTCECQIEIQTPKDTSKRHHHPKDARVSVHGIRVGILDQELTFGRVQNGNDKAEHHRDAVKSIRNRIEESE